MNQNQNQRQLGYLLSIASLAAICVATISPFNFVVPDNFSESSLISGFIFGSSLKDYWQNILLFIPWGWGIGVILAARKQSLLKILGWCLVSSFLFSATIELAQLLLPSRVSNFTDLINNTLGGGLGGLAYHQSGKIVRFIILIITGNLKQLTYKSILMASGSYYALIGVAIVLLLTGNNLNNWDDNYYVTIGNEVTGDRPWDGSLQSLYISDRALDPQQVNIALSQPRDFFEGEANLITSITFDQFDQQQAIVRDRTSTLPDLIWQEKSIIEPRPQDNSPIFRRKINPHPPEYYAEAIDINRRHWLKTKDPATSFGKRFPTSDQFTLSATVATHHLQQGGPARIMSMANGVFAQNLLLAQRQDNLYFRLRTPITGHNPVDPSFEIPQVFDDFDFHHLLITFRDKRLTFYLDRPENKYIYTFRPDVHFTIFVPWTNRERVVKLNNFSLVRFQLWFYGAILLPLLGAIILVWLKFRGRSVKPPSF